MSETGAPKAVIGWREYVALPAFGISRIRAKADTGARSSAIDVAEIEEMAEGRVRFSIVTNRASKSVVEYEAPIARKTRVKSAHGTVQERIFIETAMRLGGIEKTIELGLVCRRKMLCRMLIGRQALEPEFLVDPARRYVFGRRKRRKRPDAADAAGAAIDE